MGWAAPVLAIVGGAAQISGGISQNNQSKAAAAQYDQNAKNAMTAADQMEAQRRQDFLSTTSATNAIRTARGLDIASPTGMAIFQDTQRRAEQGINTERLNYLQQAQSDKTQAGILRSQGSSAMLGGFLKGGASIYGGIRDLG